MRDQHQRAADHGVEEELDRRVAPPRPAPDADHEEHRAAASAPRTAGRAGGPTRPGPRACRPSRISIAAMNCFTRFWMSLQEASRSDGREERRQQDQPEREAVDAERVVDAELRDPGRPSRRAAACRPPDRTPAGSSARRRRGSARRRRPRAAAARAARPAAARSATRRRAAMQMIRERSGNVRSSTPAPQASAPVQTGDEHRADQHRRA